MEIYDPPQMGSDQDPGYLMYTGDYSQLYIGIFQEPWVQDPYEAIVAQMLPNPFGIWWPSERIINLGKL